MIVPDRGGLRFGQPTPQAGLASSPVDFRNQPSAMGLFNNTFGQNTGFANQGPMFPATMNDMQNTGMTMGQMQPAVVGAMADQYAQRAQEYSGLGGMNQGLGNMLGSVQQPQPNFFQNNLNSSKSIPEMAASTVGQAVSQAIQSRIPQMSQGIGSLIGRSLLSSGQF